MINEKKLRAALELAMEGVMRVIDPDNPRDQDIGDDVYVVLERICEATKKDGDWTRVDEAMKGLKRDMKEWSKEV